MRLRPLHDWVVIERSEPETTDLWLPDKPSNQGRVIAVGPKVKEVCVGDWVWFNGYAGWEICFSSRKSLILRDLDIIIMLD